MTTSSGSEPNPSSSSRWVWLWTIMKFFWGSVVLAALINLLTSDVILSALFSWIEQHRLLSALLSTGLVVLSAVAWWTSRHTSRISSLVRSLSLEQQNRNRFLTKLQNRYDDILEHSLQGATQIVLTLHSKPNAVINTTRVQFRQMNLPTRILPADTSLLNIYDQASGELLLLGNPGTGKTTLLLNLAQTLCQRAKQGEHTPLPVIVNLSTWANTRKPLQEWLVEEIARSYYVPRSLIAHWVQEDQVLPLLDGLDEVPKDHRSACIDAMNTFKQHHLVPLIVCSRMQEYTAAQCQLVLHNAVVIQPLEEEQVDDYFQAAGTSLSGIRSVLHKNIALRELVRTPLMLHVVTLAYQGVSVQDLPKKGTIEEQQRQILEQYVQRRLKDQEAILTQHTLHWLTFLARQMRVHNQTIFYLEHVQPDWLPSGRLRQIYETLAVTFVGILMGVLVSLLVRVGFFGVFLSPHVIKDVLVGGLLGGLMSGSPLTVFRLTAVPQTWVRRWKHFFLLSASNGVLLAVTVWIMLTIARSAREGLIFGIGIGLCGFLLSSVIKAGKITVPPGTKPRVQSQRWWHDWLIAGIQLDDLRLGGVASLLIGLCYGLSYGLHTRPIFGLGAGLIYGLIFGIVSTVLSLLLLRKGNTVDLAEIMAWSVNYRRIRLFSKHQWRITLSVFLLVSLLYGLGIGLIYRPICELGSGLIEGLRAGLIASFLSWVLRGIWYNFSSAVLDDHHRIRPNQGIRQSVSNGILAGLVFGGICGLIGFLIAVLTERATCYGGVYGGFSGELRDGLAMGITGALVAALLIGGLAALRHFLLRVLLARAGLIPWQTIRFLDDVARRILLYKDGGGYCFIHRLFLDYFADLEASSFSIQQGTYQTTSIGQ